MGLSSAGMMTGKAGFTSHYLSMVLFHKEVGIQALELSGQIIRDHAKSYVSTGMIVMKRGGKSGEFVGMSSPTLEESISYHVIKKNPFNPRVEIGTDKDYGAYWEFGHQNLFTREYESDPWLYKALMRSHEELNRRVQELIWSEANKRHRALSSKITGARSWLYRTSKLMGDINAVVNLGGFSQYRSGMLQTARLLGDVNAARKGNFIARGGHRFMGRAVSRGWFRRVQTGNMPVPRRVVRNIVGRRFSGVFSLHTRDHLKWP